MTNTNEVWGVENANYEETNITTGVWVNGAIIPVEVGAGFVDTIKQASLDAGFGKYRVFLNENEIKPSDAPAVFAEGDKVELRPYDNAGIIG